MVNGKPKGLKTPENAETRAVAKISCFRLLPRASVCARARFGSVVSLVSDIYPIAGVVKSGREGVIFRKTERREELKNT